MKIFKYLFFAIVTLIIVFAAAAVAIPYFYKDRLLLLVKTELDENLDAKTDFKDISLSLFQHFPHLSVRILGLSVVGKEKFKHDTLLVTPRIDLSLDLVKAINGKYDILKVFIKNPRINLIVLPNGRANWNITKPAKKSAKNDKTATHFALNLRRYSIEHGDIDYRDEQNKIYFEIEDLEHTGKGKFKEDEFTLKTNTTAKSITFKYGTIQYLNKVKTDINTDIEVNSKLNKYSFDTKEVRLNGLYFATKGFIELKDTLNTIVNLEFKTPSNDFKDILSLVPGVYQDNFKNLKTTGKAMFAGKVKGTYNPNEIPTFDINVEVENGSLQYPDLPQKISNVSLKFSMKNPDGNIDHTVIDLEKGHLNFGEEPFDFGLKIKTPVSDKWVEGFVKGKIDLAHVDKFIKLSDSSRISGTVETDLQFKGTLADVEKREFDSLDANGMVSVSNLVYWSKEFPEKAILNNLVMTFAPEYITVKNLSGVYLNTNISGEGTINNLLGYILHSGTLSGSIHLFADKIDGNKWKSYFMKPTPKTRKKEPHKTEEPFIAPAKINLTLEAEVREVEYDHVKIKNILGQMLLGDEIINIKNVQAHALDGEVKIDGYYSTKEDKKNPNLDFEYFVSMGKMVLLHRHITKL